MFKKIASLFCFIVLISTFSWGQKAAKKFRVIAYYTGDSALINQYNIGQLDQIIFSFCHLKGAELHVDKMKDTVTIRHLVNLKKKYPKLHILLSMGGWSACASCSDVFSTHEGRQDFSNSTKQLLDYFGADGIDLDWEYPTIEGFPGHKYSAADKYNFTALLQQIRLTLGKKYQISFAAGGFQKYLDSAVEWQKIMPLVNNVNIMSYDLVTGYSTITGHHTPLYSSHFKEESLEKSVNHLLSLGIPSRKLIIGGAFYTRIWKNVRPENNGLYNSGIPRGGVDFKKYDSAFTETNGWKYYWDGRTQASYWYNAKDSLFATGDDIPSIQAKTLYGIKKKLGGIMFWELPLDKPQNGMLQAIMDKIALPSKEK